MEPERGGVAGKSAGVKLAVLGPLIQLSLETASGLGVVYLVDPRAVGNIPPSLPFLSPTLPVPAPPLPLSLVFGRGWVGRLLLIPSFYCIVDCFW